LQEQISRFRPGEKVLVTVFRGGKEKEINLILKNKNGNTDVLKKEKVEVLTALGASFQIVSDSEKALLKINNGVKISSLNTGKLRTSGVKEGFIITHIDKKPINNPEDVQSILEDKKGGVLIEGVYPNGLRAYYGFGL